MPLHDTLDAAIGLANRAFRGEALEQVLFDGDRMLVRLLDAARCDVLELPADGSGPRPWPSPNGASPSSAVSPLWEDDLLTATLTSDRALIRPHPDGGIASWTMALRNEGTPVGLIGVFDLQLAAAEAQPSLALAETIAVVMATAIVAQHPHQTAQWRSRLDQLLTEVSTQFIDLGAEQIDDGIVDALAVVAGSIGALHAAVYRLSVTETEAAPRRTHVWAASTSAPAAPDLSASPTLVTLVRLRRGDVVQLEAPRCESRLSLAVPLRADGYLLGFATFTAAPGQPWSSEIREAIRPLGDIIANAIGRQRVAAERHESERRYRTLVDSIAEVIVHIDARGRMSYVNRAWTELTGLTLDDMVGRGPLDSVHPDDRNTAARHMTNAMQGIDDEEQEVRFLDATGGVRWMQVKGRALFDADGNVEGFTGVLHDVTVRREAEAKVQAAAAAAELARTEAEFARDVAVRASTAKSAFLSRMSHELRTPLNAILGFGQLLQLSELGAEDVENVDQILQAGRHLLDLINEVLDVVQVESGALSLSLTPVNIGQVITESLDLLRPAIAARGIQVKAPGRQSRLLALADRRRLKQILVNLLANAVKYNVQSGEICVHCEPLPPEDAPPGLGEWLRLTVRDTGPGIAPEHFADLFTPFQRLGAEKTQVEGAGLGLALTRTLVEAFGGRIQVQSELGVGTTLLVDLPAAQPATDDDQLPAEDDPIAPSYTVLYVEDNQSNVMLLRRVIARRSHLRLLVAQDGLEGVETAQRIEPDLILLDLHLPGLDGTSVLTALRGSDRPAIRDVPIVVLTADLTPEAETRVIAAGATVFLTKPIDIPHLLGVIDQHLPQP